MQKISRKNLFSFKEKVARIQDYKVSKNDLGSTLLPVAANRQKDRA